MYAFRLDTEHKETFSGGSVVCSPLGHMFDIGQSLENGKGVIYTTSEFLGEALARYPGLERLPEDELPEGLEPVQVPGAGQALTPETLTKQEPVVRGEGEIPAEHRDEPATADDAVRAGEEVSGGAEPVPAGGRRNR